MKKFVRFWFFILATILPWVAVSQTNTLTVADGTATNGRLPVYGLYTDVLQRGQIIYPASMIEAAAEEYSMTDGSITSMTFYLSSPANQAWTCPFTVTLMEVPGISLGSFANTSTLGTVVYTGTLDGSQSTMTINFTTPYTYNGGNLLVDFSNTSPQTSWASAYFYGIGTSYTSAWSSSDLSGSGYGYSFIPKCSFGFTGGTEVSCPSVRNLAVTNIADTQITLSWSSSSISGATYTIYDAADTSVLATGITGNGYTVTGLVPNTDYTFIVEVNCSATESSLWREVSVTTTCGAFPLPYSTGFEEMPANDNPQCWQVLAGGPYVHEQTGAAYQGDQYLEFSRSWDSPDPFNMVAMPVITESLNGKEVRFMTRPEGVFPECGKLEVGYITDVADTSSFVSLRSYNQHEWENDMSYYEEIVEFNNVPDGARVAFRHTPTSYLFYWFVDNVTVEVQPSCARPTSFEVTDVTSTSVTLEWVDTVNSGATYTLYDYYDSTVVATGITGNSYTITGLTPNTFYSFNLEVNCSATESSRLTYVDVRTECGVQNTPFNEDFEDDNLGDHPLCWTHMTHISDYANTCIVYGQGAYESERCLRFNYSLSTGNTILLPEFSAPTNTLRMRFMHRAEPASTVGNLEVGYVTDTADASSFVTLATLNRLPDYSRAIVDFSQAPANARMAIRHVSDGTNLYWLVDDITVEPLPNCVEPVSLVLESVTDNSVTVSWNSTNAGSYQVIARQGYTYNWSTQTIVADTVATLTGLNYGEDYTIQVRGICGNDSSIWSDPMSVHIGYCLPIPHTVDGLGITNVTFGYDNEVVNNNQRPLTDPYYADYSNLVGALPAAMPVTVAITYNTSYSYGTLIWIDLNRNMMFEDDEVVYSGMSSNDAPTTLNATFVIDPQQDTGLYRMRIGGADMAFDYYVNGGGAVPDACGEYSWSVFEDYTVRITEAPACAPVFDVVCSDVTANSATVSWNHTGVATFSIMDGDNVVVSGITGTTVTLTGLNPSTRYTLMVVANCVSGDDAFGVPFSFTTLCDGAQPLPFVESFEDSSTTVGCWAIVSNNAANDWGTYNGLAWVENDGHRQLRFSSYATAENGDYNQYAGSPDIDGGSADALKLDIRYWTHTTTDLLYFGYRVEGVWVWDPVGYYSSTPTHYIAYIPSTAEKVGIRYFGDYRYYAYIDSVSVTEAVVNEVTLLTNDASRGMVNPANVTIVPEGDSFTATAIPQAGYRFAAWVNNAGEVVSTENPYTFVPTTDTTLTAVFGALYTVVVTCDDTLGAVLGTGVYSEFDTVTIYAVPNDGYTFLYWTVDDQPITTENPFSFLPIADVIVNAVFIETQIGYLVNVSCDPRMGTVTGSGDYVAGDIVTLTATANPGYRFVAWMNGSTQLSTDNPYSFEVNDNMDILAVFVAAGDQYTVTVNYNSTMGTVTGAGTYNDGATVTLTAIPNEGYEFRGWIDGIDEIDDNPYVFTLTSDRTLSAIFRVSTDGIDDVENSRIALYPNPATTTVTLTGLTEGSTVTVLDLNGRTVESQRAVSADGKMTIDLNGFAKGAYFVRIVNAGSTAVRKLIVR